MSGIDTAFDGLQGYSRPQYFRPGVVRRAAASDGEEDGGRNGGCKDVAPEGETDLGMSLTQPCGNFRLGGGFNFNATLFWGRLHDLMPQYEAVKDDYEEQTSLSMVGDHPRRFNGDKHSFAAYLEVGPARIGWEVWTHHNVDDQMILFRHEDFTSVASRYHVVVNSRNLFFTGVKLFNVNDYLNNGEASVWVKYAMDRYDFWEVREEYAPEWKYGFMWNGSYTGGEVYAFGKGLGQRISLVLEYALRVAAPENFLNGKNGMSIEIGGNFANLRSEQDVSGYSWSSGFSEWFINFAWVSQVDLTFRRK